MHLQWQSISYYLAKERRSMFLKMSLRTPEGPQDPIKDTQNSNLPAYVEIPSNNCENQQ